MLEVGEEGCGGDGGGGEVVEGDRLCRLEEEELDLPLDWEFQTRLRRDSRRRRANLLLLRLVA